jgi:hypothetical protein
VTLVVIFPEDFVFFIRIRLISGKQLQLEMSMSFVLLAVSRSDDFPKQPTNMADVQHFDHVRGG